MNVCLFHSALSLFVLCSEIIRMSHESSEIVSCRFNVRLIKFNVKIIQVKLQSQAHMYPSMMETLKFYRISCGQCPVINGSHAQCNNNLILFRIVNKTTN